MFCGPKSWKSSKNKKRLGVTFKVIKRKEREEEQEKDKNEGQSPKKKIKVDHEKNKKEEQHEEESKKNEVEPQKSLNGKNILKFSYDEEWNNRNLETE